MLKVKEEIIEDEIDTNFWVKTVRPLSGDDELLSNTQSDDSDSEQESLQRNGRLSEIRLEIFSCNVCGMQFLNYDELKDHGRAHNNKRMQKMGAGEILTDPGLLPPGDEAINPFASSEASFRCLECLREFDTESNFEAHLKRHGGEKRFPCPHCDECFSSTSARKKHARIHVNIKSFYCDICDAGFPDSQALKSHMSTHAKDEMFVCSICGTTFMDNHQLQNHYKIHTEGLRRSQRKLNGKNAKDLVTLNVQNEGAEKHEEASNISISGVLKNGMRLRQNINHKVIRNKSTVKQEPSEEPLKRNDHLKNSHRVDDSRERGGGKKDKFYCTKCSNSYFLKSSLQRHIRWSHGSSAAVKNKPDADSASSSSPGRKTQRGKGSLKCKYCGQFFAHSYTLSAHVRTHTGNYVATCDICNKGFVYTSHYNRHMRIHKGIKPYKCSICFMKFSQKHVLAGHMKVHDRFGEWNKSSATGNSAKMGKVPSVVRNKNIGTKVMSGYHPYECEICGAKYALKTALYGHMKAHGGKRHKQQTAPEVDHTYTCDECGKHFITSQGLGTHKLTHKGHWGCHYKCQKCGKGFNNIAHYRKHRTFHTEVKPYRCPECKIYFTFGSSLRRHLKAEHGRSEDFIDEDVDEPTTVRKTKFCDICNRHFSSKYTFKSHMRLHTGDGLFTCNVCKKTFNYRSHLTIHMRIHEGVKPFKCDVCNVHFTQKSSLKKHLLTTRHLDWTKFKNWSKSGMKSKRRPLSGDRRSLSAVRDTSKNDESNISIKPKSDIKDRGIFDVMMECLDEEFESKDRQRKIKSPLRYPDSERQSTSYWKGTILHDAITSPSDSNYVANENLTSDNIGNNDQVFNKFFGRQSNLVIGRKRKIGIKFAQSLTTKRYPCNFCDQSFDSIIKKILHEKRHRNFIIRPFICCVCGNLFSTSAKLRDHTRKHTGEPYPCHLCGLKFKHEKNIKEHRKQHDLKKYKHPYICAVCSLGFQHEQPFMSHLEKYHSGRLSAAKNFTNRQSCMELMDHDYSRSNENIVLFPPLA